MIKELYNHDYYNNSEWSGYMDDPFRVLGYAAAIKEMGARYVLDVGCGKNNLVRALKSLGLDAIGVDPSEDSGADYFCNATLLPFHNKEFDLAVTTDVLEHLDRVEIHQAIGEMKRCARQQAHVICFREMHVQEHDPYHVTLEPREWWLNEFSKHLLGLTAEIEVRWHVQNAAGGKRLNGFYMMVF